MPSAEAASILHKDPGYVRLGLQQDILPFGSAVRVSDKRWSYNIIKKKLYEYAGIEE